MAYDFSQMSDADIDARIAELEHKQSEPVPQPQAFDDMSDDDIDARIAELEAKQGNPRRMTREERIAANNRAIETARSQKNPGFLSAAGEAIAEGVKGAGRAVKSVGEGIVGMGSGAVRLAGTPVRMLTGWEGLHKLADTIDQSYANFGADALMSDYGEDPDGWGFALGRFGEKLAGTAGSLAALGGVSKGVGLVDKALKAAGHTKTAAAVSNLLPAMFGNDAAVRAYDTARKNEKSRTEAAALAGMNGAIHFFGFKAFENKALNKMLGMPAELNSSLPTWATQAMEARAPHSFSDLVRGMRNGMIKYTLAERGKGALRAGGIMAVQDMLSDVPMQVAEGGSWDDIDFNRVGKKGLHGLVEGGLMEGSLGAAAMLRSNAAAKKFVADKFYRGENYKVAGPDGREYTEPGLLNTPQGRMLLMKQNPAATERVLDIVEHGGKPRAEELDAAFLPSDMNETELRRFAADWREDLRPYVDEAWNADQPTRMAAPAESAANPPRRKFLSPEEAEVQQRAMNDAAERGRVEGRIAERDQARADEQRAANDEQERVNAEMLAREERRAREGQEAYDQAMLEREEARARAGEKPAEPSPRPQESAAEPETTNEPPKTEKPAEAVSDAATAKPAETPVQTGEVSSSESAPEPVKEKTEPKPGAMSPTQKRNRLAKVQGIVDKIDPDLAIDTKALRYGQNNPNGLKLGDLKMLDDPANDGWQYELGLPKERADELRKAVHDAYEEQRMASPNRKDKANETGQDTYSVSASQALERLAAKPNDFKRLGIAHEQVSAAMEAAKRQGDEQGSKFWEDRLSSLNQQIENLAPHEQAKVANAIQNMQTKKSAMERKDTQSLETGEDKTLDVAASEEDVAQTNSIKGRGGKGGSLEGNRHLRIDKIEGDKLTVTLMDAAGKPLGPSRPMKRAEWEILGKAAKTNDNIDGDPSNPQKGDMLRMSKGEAETPEARDLRFKTDADYQKWLKDRGANDAPIMRERYEGEQAKNAAKVGKNFFLGTDVKLDAIGRDYNPETDGGKKIVDQDSGRVVGTFNRDTNEIKLFRGANVKTLVHELGGHAVRKYAEQLAAQGDRKLLDRIDRVVDEAEKFAPEIVKSVKERYPDAKGDELRDEIWAALRERHSEAMEKTVRTLQGKAWYNRAWAAFKEAWQGILAKMGFNRADLSKINRMDHDEFLDFLDRTMAEGKTIGRLETGGAEGTRAKVTDTMAQGIVDNLYPPPFEAKPSEGAQLGNTHAKGVADASSPDGNKIVANPAAESKGGATREARAPKPAGYKIMDDQQTKGEKFKEKFLDRLASVESVQDEIGGVKEIVGADGYTDHRKSTDYVAAADKANGRIEHEMRDLQHRSASVDKTLSEAALKGQSTADLVSDFDLYLQCKHAPERNRTIAERNGVTYDADYYYGMGKVPLPGGNSVGLSENVANRLLRGLEGKYGSLDKFEEAAKKVYEINRADIQRRVEAGRLTPQDANQYLYRWQRYVPLKTDMERLEPEGFNSSTASMRRNEFMKAQGRANADIADSPLAASILQAEQGIRGAIKNELANVGANLVEHAAAQGKPIGEIVRGEMLPKGAGWTFTLDDGTRVTVGGSMKLAENRPDVHLFKRDGELMAYRIDKGANGRGLAFSRAMSGENMGKWGNGMEWVPKMTAWMSAMRTQYSPEFTVSNLLADHLEAYQALVGRYGIKSGTAAFGKMVASEIQNAKDLKDYLKTGMMSRDVGEAVRAGLLTKGGVASEGFEGKEQSIRNRIEDFRRKERKWRDMSAADWAKGGWQNVTEFISFANEMAEYSTRMGIFSALKKQGVPVKDAVKFARDATVNFNRKGTSMPLINGLYMFANASVQGAMRSVQAMRDEHGKELVGLLVGVGVAKAVIDHYLGNDDERDKKGGRNARNLSEYDRKHNVGVPVGGGYQFVPFRFRGPYAAIPYLAQTAANVALGERTPKAGALSLVRELGDQVTDIVGGNGIMNDKGEFDGSLAMQSIAPSVVDPFVQLASGKDYKGDDRKARTFDKTTPVSSNGRRSTSEIYKGMAKGLNWLSGGNEFRKGLVDVAPEDLQLVLEFLGGGPMRDAHNTVATAHNVAQRVAGGTPERTLSQVPFVRRIVKEYPENTSRYYDALDGYERDKAEFKKTVDLKRRAEFGRAHPYVRPMPDSAKSRVDVLAERIKELTHLERGEVKSGQKWVERKTPLAESQKETFRKRRLELQAKVLGLLGG